MLVVTYRHGWLVTLMLRCLSSRLEATEGVTKFTLDDVGQAATFAVLGLRAAATMFVAMLFLLYASEEVYARPDIPLFGL